MSKKAPKFNQVLEDFRKFIGEDKIAEVQDDSETQVSYPSRDEDANDAAPKNTSDGTSKDNTSNRGVSTGEKLQGAKEPKTQEHEKKEVPASSKVAGEGAALVNRLMGNIKEAADQLSQDAGSTTIDEDALAEKIAAHYRNVSVGYELGKYLFGAVGQKLANEAALAASVAAGQEAPQGEVDPQEELEAFFTALQELVQEGQITEEQAQQAVMDLQQALADDGQGAPQEEIPQEETPQEEIPQEEAPQEEVEKGASELFSPEQIQEIENNINSKVAEWTAEGRSDSEITEMIKASALQDSQIVAEKLHKDAVVESVLRKEAALRELGASDDDVRGYFEKAAQEEIESENLKVAELEIENLVNQKVAELANAGYSEPQIYEALKIAAQADAQEFAQAQEIEAINQVVNQKVAELADAGYNESQIDEYLKAAAEADAAAIIQAQRQEGINQAISQSVLQKRAEDEDAQDASQVIQEIFQSLEALLQSGQITEEEAAQVLTDLGLVQAGEEGQEEVAPETQAPPQEEGAPVEEPQPTE